MNSSIRCVIVCISVASLALAAESEEENGKIVGGRPATKGEFPYQLSLRSDGSHICGASYIGNSRAVTAAHCTDGATASQLSVLGGTRSTFSIGGEVRDVVQIKQHPNYNSEIVDFDISVLILSADFPTNNAAIKPIPLCSAPVPVGAMTQITGWGTLFEGVNAPSLFLQAADVPIVDKVTCEAAYGQDDITEQMICAGYPQGGTDTCQGDSGGPLAYNKELCGITSWGNGCARPNYPGVYTDVTQFINFINQS